MKEFFRSLSSEAAMGFNLVLDIDTATYVESQILCGVLCRLSLLTALQENTDTRCFSGTGTQRSCNTDTQLFSSALGQTAASDTLAAQIPTQSPADDLRNVTVNVACNDERNIKGCDSRENTGGKETSESQEETGETQKIVVGGQKRLIRCDKCQTEAPRNGNSCEKCEHECTKEESATETNGQIDTFDETLGGWCDDGDTYSNPQTFVLDSNWVGGACGNGQDVSLAGANTTTNWTHPQQDWTENWDNELTESVPYHFSLDGFDPNRESLWDNLPAPEYTGSVEDSTTHSNSEDRTVPTERDYELITCNPRKLYVNNIAYRTSQHKLWKFLEENFGAVEYCQLLKDKWNHSKGRGFVTFKQLDSVEKIQAADGGDLVLDRRELRVEQATWKQYTPRWEEMRRKTQTGEPTEHVDLDPDGARNVTERSQCVEDEQVDLKAGDKDSNYQSVAAETASDDDTNQCRDLSPAISDTNINSGICEINHATTKKVEAGDVAHAGIDGCESVVSPGVGSVSWYEEQISLEAACGSGADIHCLNDYILLYILSYLPLANRVQCERVCKKWQSVCGSYWLSVKHLSFTGQINRYTVFTDRVLKQVLKWGCPRLESLDLSAVSRTLTGKVVQTIGKNCPNLKKIDLAGMTLNHKALRSLSEMCRNIEWISLRNCHEVTEKGMWSLFVNCKQLTYINLADNRRINGKCFHVSGHHVVTLDLSDCVQLSDEGLKKLADRWTPLQELHLSGALNITNGGLRPLCESLKSLRVLSLCGTIAGVSSLGLRSLSELKLLEELDLNRNNSVDDAVLSAVAYHCLKLRKLDLTLCGEGVTDAAMCALAFSPGLEDLALSYLINVEQSGLTQIAANGRLQKLVARGCSAIPEQAFLSVVTLCPRLTHLDVCGCGQVTLELVSVCVRERLRRNSGKMDLEGDERLDLHIGGTSVSREDVPPIPDESLRLHHHNLCIDYLRPDRELFFGDMLFDDEEDDFSDEFNEFMDPYDFEDEFLYNDDPLLNERFMVS